MDAFLLLFLTVKIIFSASHSFDNDLLETIRCFARYLSQISVYKNELAINLSNSMENLEVNVIKVVEEHRAVDKNSINFKILSSFTNF
jgi:hypothetical protein